MSNLDRLGVWASNGPVLVQKIEHSQNNGFNILKTLNSVVWGFLLYFSSSVRECQYPANPSLEVKVFKGGFEM